MIVAFERDGALLGPGEGMARIINPGDKRGGAGYSTSRASVCLVVRLRSNERASAYAWSVENVRDFSIRGATGQGRQVGAVLEWHCLMLCSVLSSGATGEELMLYGPGSLREVMTQGATDYQTAYSVMVRTEFEPSSGLSALSTC